MNGISYLIKEYLLDVLDKWKNIILWIWQLPQNICGFLYKKISRKNRICQVENQYTREVGAEVNLKRSKGGVTLGKYIFICQDYTDKTKVIKHECGHVRQSKILGPLYLLVIGLPSIIHAVINGRIGCCYDKEGNYNYHHFYTEWWLTGKYNVNK